MNYVFDVDGTLTPSRKRVDPAFEAWFLNFTKSNKVYLVSGSDYPKTLEQLGEDICKSVAGVYSCAGNALYVNGEEVYSNPFSLTDEEHTFLETLLDLSAYPDRTGQHIEMRQGLCNFSIVGRGATNDQRESYIQYDTAINERENLTELINNQFPRLEATIAGETGIDIYLRGKDKSQVADVLSPFTFFGDKIHEGGNDYTIAQRAEQFYKVNSWEETFSMLRQLFP